MSKIISTTTTQRYVLTKFDVVGVMETTKRQCWTLINGKHRFGSSQGLRNRDHKKPTQTEQEIHTLIPRSARCTARDQGVNLSRRSCVVMPPPHMKKNPPEETEKVPAPPGRRIDTATPVRREKGIRVCDMCTTKTGHQHRHRWRRMRRQDTTTKHRSR